MIKSDVIYMYAAGISVPPNPWTINDNFRTCRVYYIHKGCAYFILNGIEYLLKPEYIYFFPPNLPFISRNDLSNPILHTYFDFIMLPPLILDSYVEINTNEHLELKYIIQSVNELINSQSYIMYINNDHSPIFYCLETILSMIVNIKNLTYISDPFILKSLDIIHSEFNTKLTVNDIAQRLGFNTDFFIRKFKTVLKITPYSYIKSLKIREALKMRESGMSNDEIAAKLSYSDSTALCHALVNKKSVSVNH